MTNELGAVFLRALPAATARALGSKEAVVAWLDGALRDAETTFGGLEVDRAGFVRYLADKVPELPEPAALRMRTTDLYLAYACLTGNAPALATFEQTYFPAIDRALARMGIARTDREDIQGSLRGMLFCRRTDAPPAIAAYSGSGDLANWVRSVARHAAVRARKREGDRQSMRAEFHEAAELLPAADDPELEYMRTHYIGEFKGALRAAFDTLPTRERNLLRQHYLDGLTIEAVARLHRVHRATAARWLADAREVVLVKVRKEMRLRCGISETELESLVSAARNGFDLSVSRVLRRASPQASCP